MQPKEHTELERILPLEISYYYYSAWPQTKTDPAEPASVEVESLKLWGVELIEAIPEKTLRQLHERLLEDHCNE